jgi:hypothetical protein
MKAMKPYIGLIHDSARIIVDIRTIMASSESEAYLRFAQLIPSSGVNLADVKIVVWEACSENTVCFGHDHTEDYWTTTTTFDPGITTT